jgi:hypothetical protein
MGQWRDRQHGVPNNVLVLSTAIYTSAFQLVGEQVRSSADHPLALSGSTRGDPCTCCFLSGGRFPCAGVLSL